MTKRPRVSSSSKNKTTIVRAVLKSGATVSDALRKRGLALLALIDRRKESIVEDFYDIGMALHEIQHRKISPSLGFRSFGDLVETRVGMSRPQALKLVLVATNYDRERALALGLEKAYQIVRYTEATPEPDNAKFLLESGAKIGKKLIADSSVRDLVAATRAVRAKTARGKAVDEEAEAAKKEARKLQVALRKRGAHEASVAAVKEHRRWVLRIDVPVGEAKRLY